MNDIEKIKCLVSRDDFVWNSVKNDPRPKLLYGTGNGADKIIKLCKKEGIEIADCAVSDDFAKGQLYLDRPVISVTEACEKYDSCIFLVAFATREKNVIEKMTAMSEKHRIVIPDVPVADEELFDYDFFLTYADRLFKAYCTLSDDISKQILKTIILYKLTGQLSYLLEAISTDLSFLDFGSIKRAVDCGAYDGDTLRDLAEYAINLEISYAIEPDRVNFRKLTEYAKNEQRFSVVPIQSAVWSEDGETEFYAGGNRGSSLFYVGHKAKRRTVSLRSVDSILDGESIDYIKFDTEGAELQALEGARSTIEKYRPIIKVSAYHRSKDIFSLVEKISELCNSYEIYLRRNPCIPAWEAELYAIPK